MMGGGFPGQYEQQFNYGAPGMSMGGPGPQMSMPGQFA
jgi:translation elongation factor EF-Tu-like GTPase